MPDPRYRTPTHPCPLSWCGVEVKGSRLMCPMHWRLVPAALKAEVYATWRAMNSHANRGNPDVYAAYDAARTAAIRSITREDPPA